MKIVALDSDTLGKDLPLELLKEVGDITVYGKSTPEEAKARVTETEVLLINKVRVDKDLMDIARGLKLICVFATGFDNIDVGYAKEKGIAVCNVPGYSTDSVALYTVSTALALYTRLNSYSAFVKSGAYSKSGAPNRLEPVYHELRGKVWGIIGCGNIGGAVARVAEAFGARVLVNKRTPVKEYNCVDIETLCRESDIITIHCPLNDKSRNLINKSTIDLMKNDVCIVNSARGAIINDNDITEAILNGKIGAFGSDVYTQEPFGTDHPFNKIKDLDNVILTPHCAWGAYEARLRCLNIVISNIKAFISGEMLNRVDI